MGEQFARMLKDLPSDAIDAVRSRGLWAGIDLAQRDGRDVCEGLLNRGVLAKEAHDRTIRLAPLWSSTRPISNGRWGSSPRSSARPETMTSGPDSGLRMVMT